MNALLVDLEGTSEILEENLTGLIDEYVDMLTVYILTAIIVIGVAILGSSIIYNTVVYRQIVYRFLESFLRISVQDIEFLFTKTSRFARRIEKASTEELSQGSMYDTADLDSFDSFHILAKKSGLSGGSSTTGRKARMDKKKKLKTSGFLIAALRDALIIFTVLMSFAIIMLVYNLLA
eukprot:CAMPEP_0114583942 /NCGR_PEP_ID=MMETSP0125-20121206/7625_1 /TAXON_ID=485358 ORGANISM="Aristerostoma sp., Strain ATCC 50986" /NCGR_SAMPLE_ID=MMETSP0125 /ASSEMBLY_ACC=CAM_ASM_000245 /LENGTH=177 /DNA_ID=CAMNT_0001777803 /DNA_START=334 /DNA_END=867 /DNA_ORIENTATION=-